MKCLKKFESWKNNFRRLAAHYPESEARTVNLERVKLMDLVIEEIKKESFGTFVVKAIYEKYIFSALESRKEQNMKMYELQAQFQGLHNEIERLMFELETIRNANQFLIKENKKLESKINRIKNIFK